MEKKNKQIIELLKQQDQVQQLVATHQKTEEGKRQNIIEKNQQSIKTESR